MANNQEQANDTKISVSLNALREVLTALNNSAGYEITELQVTRDRGRGLFIDNPIDVLINEYKEFMAKGGWPTATATTPTGDTPNEALVTAKVTLYRMLLAHPQDGLTEPEVQVMRGLAADTSVQVIIDAAAVQAMVTGSRNESQPR